MTVHEYIQGRVALGRTPIGNRAVYGTTARCSGCDWKYRTNESPAGQGKTYAKAAHAAHVIETLGSIERKKVTWTRWDAKRRRNVTSHPTMWIWTDPEGTERSYDTKREAEEARRGWDS